MRLSVLMMFAPQQFRPSALGNRLHKLVTIPERPVSMDFGAFQLQRLVRGAPAGFDGGSRLGGGVADALRPLFRRNPSSEGCRSSAPGSSTLALQAGRSPLFGSHSRVGCGKVTNRTSEPFRSVRQLHLTSYSAGTGLPPKRYPHKGGEPSADWHRSPVEETKKREFRRQALVGADYMLARTGVCWGQIDFV